MKDMTVISIIGLALFLSIAALQGAVSAQNAGGQDTERRELADAVGLDGVLRALQARPAEPEDESAFTSCPEGYPSFGKLGELLRAWSPNEPEEPEGAVVERLQVLNYSDPDQRKLAAELRDCEVPFKIFGIPEAEAASAKWTDEYLMTALGNSTHCTVMRSESNRFMFWHKPRSPRQGLDWTPPTEPQHMTFEQWRQWTKRADENKIGPNDVHYYLTTGVDARVKTPPATGQFLADDLPFFSTNTDNFFITDVQHQKGIQCRFGARGIIAESHFDHGKNFVLMLRGRKRYLLNPPEACPSLGIISDKSHPSFRHSELDWADESDWPEGFAEAPALETVLEAGEMLYIPSFWYHYIVSERFNVQCNARAGLSMRKKWVQDTEKCFGRRLPEEPPTLNHRMDYLRDRAKDGKKEFQKAFHGDRQAEQP